MEPRGSEPGNPDAEAWRRERRAHTRRRQVLRRRLALGCVGAAIFLVGGLAFLGRALGGEAEPAAAGSVQQRRPALAACSRPKAEAPGWLTGRRATVLVDSVLLGAVPALRGNMARWQLDVRGHPAIMVKAMDEELASTGTGVGPLVVVGVGYNSLWERGRKNYATWSREFDRRARQLLATAKRLGARQFVWVTLRDARQSVIPSNSLWQYRDYAWYFPYVNERLRRIDRRRSDLVLADWAAVSDRRGLTYDAIHVDPDGAALMARTIRKAIETEGKRQAEASRPVGAGCASK